MQNKHLRVLTFSALLVAMEVVLDRFLSLNNTMLKIGFSFVPVVIAAILYGPIVAALVYGLGDFIGAILFPIGPYFPGFTLSCALMGLVYGLCLYRGSSEQGTFRRWLCRKWEGKYPALPGILLATLINYGGISLLLNSYWLSILTDNTFPVSVGIRVSQVVLYIPANLVLIPFLMRLCERLKTARNT